MPPCQKPYITSQQIPAPCGQCPSCLCNRKQLWTHRILLESYGHENNSFVTLTYNEENLPLNSEGIPTLRKRDGQLFIKRLRRRLDHPIRYYLAGEYGTAGTRGINPHFHLAIFGIGKEHEETIQDAWRSEKGTGNEGEILGFTSTDLLEPASAAYIAGYVQKKNKYNQDMYEELNIVPEYSSMSTKPAIGAHAITVLAKTLQDKPELLTETGDVPFSLKHGKRSLPLGKYLREKLREELQLDHTLETEFCPNTGEILNEKKIWHPKERQKDLYKTQLSLLQKNTQNDQKLPKDAKVSIKHLMAYIDKQEIINFNARQKNKKNAKSL
jgi:hypothetical protein